MFYLIAQAATQPNTAQDLTILLTSGAGIGIATGIVLKAIKEWLPANRLPLQVWAMLIAVALTLTAKFGLNTITGDLAALIIGAVLNSLTGMGAFALIDAPKDSPKTLNE